MLASIGWTQLRHAEVTFAFHGRLEGSSAIAGGGVSGFPGHAASVLLGAETASCVLFAGQPGNSLCATEYFECFGVTLL